jgi:rfaE bifunctional protein nucleotidyltransferase chain/domain
MTPDRLFRVTRVPKSSEKYATEIRDSSFLSSSPPSHSCAMHQRRSTRARHAWSPLCVRYGDADRPLLVPAAVRYQDKVVDRDTIAFIAADARRDGKRVVFTNGCFDLLHVGHVRYLAEARAAGDLLIVGINTDDSVRRLKGPARPLVSEAERGEVLAALSAVDYVTPFGEDTPEELIRRVQPDVVAKGGDWTTETVVGRDIVEARGGRVLIIPTVEGFSTTTLAERIRRSS